MEYKQFSAEIRKATSQKQAKVRNSFGVYHAYKLIRKNKWYDIGRPLKEHEFYDVVRKVNNLLAAEISNGNSVTFPARMGMLELRKVKRGVSIIEGKLRVSYPINWEKTLRVWYEDEEARKNKTLLRMENKFVYHVRYCKHKANYENKIFYEFILNRAIKKALKDNVNKGQIDTLW